MAQLHPQEIFLLERFSSVEYLRKIRDAWKEFVDHNERCLDEFMHHLPANLRSRNLSEQPDVVWQNRMLPNFQATLDRLEKGCIELANDDYHGYGAAHGISNDFKGESDFWKGWMKPEDEEKYYSLMGAANLLAKNFTRTARGTWDEGSLTYEYSEEYFGALDLPVKIPRYCLDLSVQMNSDEKIPMTGIYLPEAPNAAARFIFMIPGEDDEAPLASVWTERSVYSGITSEEWQPTRWTLVRRVEGEFIDVPPEGFYPANSFVTGRCEANHRCPGTGYWWTPARENSRRRFTEGEIMPDYPGSQYGSTIWYWDQQQSE